MDDPVPPPVPYDARAAVDADQLNLLGIFHYVLGGLTILFSSFFLFHIVMGLTMARHPEFLGGFFKNARVIVTTSPPTPSASPAGEATNETPAPADEEADESPAPVVNPSPAISPAPLPATRTLQPGEMPELPPAFGYMMAGMGAIGMLMGWIAGALIIVSGRCIRQRRARTYSLVIAGLCCLLLPFGTVLGIFAFVVLLRPGVEALYRAAAQPPPPLPRPA